MRLIILTILGVSISSSILGFQVLNQTHGCVEVKDYFHIFNRYNQHILSNQTGYCDPSSSRCTGQLDFRVIKHSDGSELQVEEDLCVWQGDVGTGQGYFKITENPNVNIGDIGYCTIQYYPQANSSGLAISD
jgi:hypothetical protein